MAEPRQGGTETSGQLMPLHLTITEGDENMDSWWFFWPAIIQWLIFNCVQYNESEFISYLNDFKHKGFAFTRNRRFRFGSENDRIQPYVKGLVKTDRSFTYVILGPVIAVKVTVAVAVRVVKILSPSVKGTSASVIWCEDPTSSSIAKSIDVNLRY